MHTRRIGQAPSMRFSTHGLAQSAMTRFFDGLAHVAVSKVGIGVIVGAMAASTGYWASRLHEHSLQQAASAASPTHATLLHPVQLESPRVNAANVVSTPASATSAVGSAPTDAWVPSVSAAPRPVPREPTVRTAVAADAPRPEQAAAGRHSGSMALSMASQLELIRRARAFVEVGDGNAALAELDAYAAQCPHGTFEEEEIALRVQALRVAGDRAGAARELVNLRSRFPQSVHLGALGN